VLAGSQIIGVEFRGSVQPTLQTVPMAKELLMELLLLVRDLSMSNRADHRRLVESVQ
jgi:hypothetical protein